MAWKTAEPAARRLQMLHADERELDLRLQTADDARDALARAARMSPAERAVSGVQVKIRQLRAADDGHIRRRRGPKARPELRALGVAGAGEELLGAPHERLAAHAIQVAVVAVELGRAR